MLKSLDEIISDLKKKSEKIKDEETRLKFKSAIDEITKIPADKWEIVSSLPGGLRFPANASQEEIRDKISEYLSKEAEKNPDYFYSGEKSEEGKKEIFNKNVEQYMGSLGYSAKKGGLYSSANNYSLTQYELFGNTNKNSASGFSIHNQSLGCVEKRKELESLSNEVSKSGDIDKYNQALREWEENNKEPIVSYDNIQGQCSGFGGIDYHHISRKKYQKNSKNKITETKEDSYKRFNKNGETVEISKEEQTQYNIEGNIHKIDTVQKESKKETIKCENGVDLEYKKSTTIKNIAGEEETKEAQKSGKKTKSEKLSLEMSSKCEESTAKKEVKPSEETKSKNIPLNILSNQGMSGRQYM